MCWIYNLPTVAGSATLRSGWNLVAHAQRADLPASPKVLGKQGGWGGCSSCLLMCKWVVFTLSRLYCTSTTLVYIYICDIRKIHMVCIYIYTYIFYIILQVTHTYTWMRHTTSCKKRPAAVKCDSCKLKLHTLNNSTPSSTRLGLDYSALIWMFEAAGASLRRGGGSSFLFVGGWGAFFYVGMIP